MGIVDQDAQALASQDMLIVHFYATPSGGATGAAFAERYASFMIEIRRGLYMNEETFEKRETFSVLKREIGRLLRSLTR